MEQVDERGGAFCIEGRVVGLSQPFGRKAACLPLLGLSRCDPRQGSAHQVQSLAMIERRVSIHWVTDNGVSHGCRMTTYLMGSARGDGPFQQGRFPMDRPWAAPEVEKV